MSTVLLVHSETSLGALPWAQRLAKRAGQDLVLLCFTTDPSSRMDEAQESPENAPELLTKLFKKLAATEGIHARVVDCRGPRPRRGVLNALEDLNVVQLVLIEALDDAARRLGAGLAGDIARAAPYDTLLLDPGSLQGEPARVLFAQVGGGGSHGLRVAARCFCSADVPLVVMPDPKASTSSARSLRNVRDEIDGRNETEIVVLDAPSSLEAGLPESAADGDLVMADANERRHLSRLLAVLRKVRVEKPELNIAMCISRSANAAGPGMVERAMERFHAHVPRLGREERRTLAERLEEGGRLSADFVIMLMLSAVIAALGLVQNSTAVVIGGMLVAPLMVPMLAMGLSLVQGNSHLFRHSFKAMSLGVLGALLAAMAVGALSPWQDLSAEVVSRGSPNVFDLAVALFSGIAAAFALARPGLAGTLVGVAVAVALVPPLAAVGIALVKGEFAIALGAAVLFLTNWLAIVLGASLVFRLFGLDVSLGGDRAPTWARAAFAAFAVALIPTVMLLFYNLELQVSDGVHRPYARPLPAPIREAIRERVDGETAVEIIAMSQSDIEHGFGREITLAVSGAYSETLRQDLQRILESGTEGQVKARVQLLQAME